MLFLTINEKLIIFFKTDDQSSATYGSSKHREMQLQLQKKLQQKNEVNRDHKRKMQVVFKK